VKIDQFQGSMDVCRSSFWNFKRGRSPIKIGQSLNVKTGMSPMKTNQFFIKNGSSLVKLEQYF
jgi:hypothetical protein